MAGKGKQAKASGMQQVREDIRQKTFRRVYLFYGDEAYLVRQYRGELIRAVCPEEGSMNLNIHREEHPDWEPDWTELVLKAK